MGQVRALSILSFVLLAACSGPADIDTTWVVAPIQVVAGYEFSCLLDANGSVYCWGDNADGQLGRGSMDVDEEIGRAGPVQGLPDGIVQIGAGDLHACARTESGEVWCWGGNMDGQIGTGAVSGAEPAPVMAGISGPAVDLSVAGRGTCVALGSGDVQCWGYDWWRVLGRTSTQAPEPNPTVVSGVTGVVQVGTSSRHACARQASGAVLCWGGNWWGEVGRGTTSGLSGQLPAPVPDLVASDITLGVNHTCAATDGGLMCWGDNRYGQIGDGELADGSPESSATIPTAISAPPGTPLVAVSASGTDIIQASTCAIGDDGTGTAALYCWGADQGGAFGSEQATPRKVTVTSPTAVGVGPKHACAIAGGRVYCWGANHHGELGNGATANSIAPVAVLPP